MSEPTLSDRLGTPPAPVLPEHPDVAQWRAATRDDVDAIHALRQAADPVDHPTWVTPREDVAESFDLPHIDPARDVIVALDADGRVIATGSAVLHPSRVGTLRVHLGGAVLPERRRTGIGARIVEWQRARGLEQLAEAVAERGDTAGWAAEMKMYAEEVNIGQQRLAESAGFTAERWFTTMVRDQAASVPDVAVPDGVTVALYTADRALDVLAARNDAFRDHWGSLPTDEASWRTFVDGPFLRPDLSRLALDADGAVIALSLASVNEEDWAALGAPHAYIDLIGVVRAHRRRGLAPLVLSRTLSAIADAGLAKAVLDVDTASPTGANTLYEGLGFTATEREIAYVVHI